MKQRPTTNDAPFPVTPPPRLSVVIVNYNVKDLLENCLHSLFTALETVSHEVFVVDNCSDDGSVDMIRAQFPEVILIENSKNLGFAKANNLALQQAHGAFLWLLNPDTLIQEDTARVMLDFFEDNPDVGMAGCKIILPSGILQLSCRRSFPSPWVSFTKLAGLSNLFPRSRVFGRYNLTYLNEDESYEVDAISGSCMFLRREVYEKIGGLDEAFFMYGEDLDWCYQTQRAGWRVYYVHTTKIIHYSGESTRRSSIDSKSVFYEAMQLFARKNLHLSPFSLAIISVAITLRLMISRSRDTVTAITPVVLDVLLIAASIGCAKLVRYGTIFPFPDWAYPIAYLVPIIVFVLNLLIAGAYSKNSYRYLRIIVGVLMGFFTLSSLTYFFKQFAFSRIIVLSSSGIVFFMLSARHIFWSLFDTRHAMSTVTGKPTLIVGSNLPARNIIRQVRTFDAKMYRIVGIIDIDRRHLGERVEGVEIIGSIENIGKTILENNISDVLFAPDVLSYAEILTIISRTRTPSVHFRLVPKSLELIIGQADMDQLTGLPLVNVECNLLKPFNRLIKRCLDITASAAGLMTLYPFVYFAASKVRRTSCPFRTAILALPSVLAGKTSLVGHPLGFEVPDASVFLDKPGVTGLAQLRQLEDLSPEEVVTLSLHYARNYSFFLDLEILARSILRCLVTRSSKNPRSANNG